jgi:hypothetical protein
LIASLASARIGTIYDFLPSSSENETIYESTLPKLLKTIISEDLQFWPISGTGELRRIGETYVGCKTLQPGLKDSLIRAGMPLLEPSQNLAEVFLKLEEPFRNPARNLTPETCSEFLRVRIRSDFICQDKIFLLSTILSGIE